MDFLSDIDLLCIFDQLDVLSLVTASLVCQRWKKLSEKRFEQFKFHAVDNLSFPVRIYVKIKSEQSSKYANNTIKQNSLMRPSQQMEYERLLERHCAKFLGHLRFWKIKIGSNLKRLIIRRDLTLSLPVLPTQICEEITQLWPSLEEIELRVLPSENMSLLPLISLYNLRVLICDFTYSDETRNYLCQSNCNRYNRSLVDSRTDFAWGTVLPAMERLECLSLTNVKFFAPGLYRERQVFVNLKALHFELCEILDFTEFNRFLAACINLENFSFFDITDGEGYLKLNRLPIRKLKVLRLRGSWPFRNIREKYFFEIANNFKQLQHLSLLNLMVSDQSVALLATGLPCLIRLELLNANLGDVALHALANEAPQLQYLDISFCRQSISDNSLTAIAKSGCLKTLVMVGLCKSQLTGQFLERLALLCVDLKAIYLSFTKIEKLEEYLKKFIDCCGNSTNEKRYKFPVYINLRGTVIQNSQLFTKSTAVNLSWDVSDDPKVPEGITNEADHKGPLITYDLCDCNFPI